MTVRVPEEELEGREPGEGVFEGVLVIPVEVALLERVPVNVPEAERVPEGVPDEERVTDTVADGVTVEEEVLLDDEPEEPEAVPDGVGEGVGNITPATYSGPAYIVPALVTEFQAFVVKVPAVAPVHTLTRERMP